jgi:hypothetical protein
MFSNVYVEQFVTDRLRERRAAAASFRTARLARRAAPAGPCGQRRTARTVAPAGARVRAPALTG